MSMTESEVVRMTENEAVEMFRKLLDVPCEMIVKYDSVLTKDKYRELVKIRCAEEMAISALEEVQQYRAIGTVKGYERAIQISIENYNLCREYKAKVQEFEAIGTVSEFREAMFFKKYFMELYGEGLEVANWHKNGDLEPLDNFIDEAFEWGKEKERGEHE